MTDANRVKLYVALLAAITSIATAFAGGKATGASAEGTRLGLVQAERDGAIARALENCVTLHGADGADEVRHADGLTLPQKKGTKGKASAMKKPTPAPVSSPSPSPPAMMRLDPTAFLDMVAEAHGWKGRKGI